MGQRLSINTTGSFSISSIGNLIPDSEVSQSDNREEDQRPPRIISEEERQNTVRLKLLKANIVAAAATTRSGTACSASPQSFRRRAASDYGIHGKQSSHSTDDMTISGYKDEQTALLLEKMKHIPPIQEFVEQMSNEEKLLKSYLDYSWVSTVAIIERSVSESMRFLAKGIGDFFNVAINEMHLKTLDSNSDEDGDVMNSMELNPYVEVKLLIVPYIHLNEGSSFSTVSFPVLDHFPVDTEEDAQTGKKLDPQRFTFSRPSRFTLALVVGPWLLFFDPLTNLIIPKKLYGMAKIMASGLPELFITKQRNKLTEKLASCIVSWNTSKLYRTDEDIFSRHSHPNVYGNGIDFIEDFIRNQLNIDYTTFPTVKYFTTFLDNIKHQGWSPLVVDLNSELMEKYGSFIEAKDEVTERGKRTLFEFTSHEQLDNMVKEMMLSDLMNHNPMTATDIFKETKEVSHFFVDVLKLMDRAWWMSHLFDINEENPELSEPCKGHHHSAIATKITDSSPKHVKQTRDTIGLLGCPFAHPIPDYEKLLECYPRRKKKRMTCSSPTKSPSRSPRSVSP